MSRYLIVANQTLGGQPLADKVRELMAGGPCQFHLVVPATHTHHQLTWTEGEAASIARHRLDDAIERLRALGADVDGEVGDARAVDAVGDAIRAQGVQARPPFDAIILSTLPPGLSRWLNQDLPNRLRRAFGIPVVHLTVDVAASA